MVVGAVAVGAYLLTRRKVPRVAGALGAYLAERRDAGRTRSLDGRLGGEHGGVSGEYVGVVVVVAALVAAIFVVPIAPTVGAWASYAVCSLFAGDCERPGALGFGGDLASGEPGFACERHRTTRGVNVNLGYGVGLDHNVDYDLARFSDGEAHLSYRRDVAGSVGAGGGLQADLYWGKGRLTLGGHASASAGLRFGEGETFVWSGPDADGYARDYASFHAMSDAPADVVSIDGRGRHGWQGSINRGGVRAGNWVASRLPGVDGLDLRDPERRLIHASGGVELEASGGLAGMPIPGEVVDTRIEAAIKRGVGHTTDLSTRERTVYIVAETGIETGGRLGSSGPAGEASWSNESIVAVTVGPDDELLEAKVTTYRVDEAGRDIAGTSDLRAAFPDRRHATGTRTGGRDALTTPSLYQVETRLDLTDPSNEDLVGRLAAGQALTAMPDVATDYAAEFALRPVHEAGTTTIVEYDAIERAYGVDVDASLIGEGSAGLVLGSDSRTVREAYHFDDGLGRYDRWLSCTR